MLVIHIIFAICAFAMAIIQGVIVPSVPDGCSRALIIFTVGYMYILQVFIIVYSLLIIFLNVIKERFVNIFTYILLLLNLLFCGWFLLVSFMVGKNMCSTENFSDEFVGLFMGQTILSGFWTIYTYFETPKRNSIVINV